MGITQKKKKKILPRFSTVPVERGPIFFSFYSLGTELNQNPSLFLGPLLILLFLRDGLCISRSSSGTLPWKSRNSGCFLVSLGRLHMEKVRREGSSESGREGKETGAFPTEIPPRIPHDSRGKINPRHSVVLLLTFPIPDGFKALRKAHVRVKVT